jgi:superfamily I DNA/RNA helicase
VPDYGSREAVANGLKRLIERAELQVYFNKNDAFTFERPGIKVFTFDTAKGLEFDTVFLPLIGDEHGLAAPTDVERNRLYVACTRARHELYFLHSPATHSWAIETLIAHPDAVDWYTLRGTEAEATDEEALPF